MSGTSNPSAPFIQAGISMAELTTLHVGGTAQWHTRVSTQAHLEQALKWASDRDLPYLYLGEGSNIVSSDKGFSGLVIQSGVIGREQYGTEVEVGGAENLRKTIVWLNNLGLGGAECLYGIPGTVAGALVGNAGAYGQQMSDLVTRVTVYSGDGTHDLGNRAIEFDYRHSIFKENRHWFIASCRLKLSPELNTKLQRTSEEILSKRLTKYPSELRCPGSFFKNISVRDVPKRVLADIPEDFIMFGKIPAGKLLEAVGANGTRKGDAQFAAYHGNLIINLGQASSNDILSLADEYSERVWERFKIRLEPEVLILDRDHIRIRNGGLPE